jgi:multidrug resistance efflux pump
LVSRVYKQAGDKIKTGDIIASLDRKLLQVELDKQLADYEKVRADFELFHIKHGSESDDTTKFLRIKQQAELNSSVKDTESAKFKMDQADMRSPVQGILIDTQGLTAGLYITPASNPVLVLDLDSLVFQMEVPQSELFQFKEERTMKIMFPGLTESFTGKQKLPTHGKNGKFLIPIPLHSEHLYPGMKGEASFKLD